jgi:hypothetical protein
MKTLVVRNCTGLSWSWSVNKQRGVKIPGIVDQDSSTKFFIELWVLLDLHTFTVIGLGPLGEPVTCMWGANLEISCMLWQNDSSLKQSTTETFCVFSYTDGGFCISSNFSSVDFCGLTGS